MLCCRGSVEAPSGPLVSLNTSLPLCRSLCVDALIELSDDNADWKLSFDEFLNCLKPGFNPPEKSMANVRGPGNIRGPGNTRVTSGARATPE